MQTSLLSHDELIELVNAGVVENCPLELVNGASIDVTLAPHIMIEQCGVSIKCFRDREPLNMLEVFMLKEEGHVGGYELHPGEFILGASEQIFNLPDDIACEYKLKSSMARVGLNHLNAGWCDPTWHGSALTMEFVNCSRYHTLILQPGDRVGQVVFFRCAPVRAEVSYAKRGRYNNDRNVHVIKP